MRPPPSAALTTRPCRPPPCKRPRSSSPVRSPQGVGARLRLRAEAQDVLPRVGAPAIALLGPPLELEGDLGAPGVEEPQAPDALRDHVAAEGEQNLAVPHAGAGDAGRLPAHHGHPDVRVLRGRIEPLADVGLVARYGAAHLPPAVRHVPAEGSVGARHLAGLLPVGGSVPQQGRLAYVVLAVQAHLSTLQAVAGDGLVHVAAGVRGTVCVVWAGLLLFTVSTPAPAPGVGTELANS